MKIVVFLTLLSLALASTYKECRGNDAETQELVNLVVTGADGIFGHCQVEGGFYAAELIGDGGPCENIFRTSVCYAREAKTQFTDDEGNVNVNWETIKQHIPYVESLGNLLCSDAKQCFDAVRAKIDACVDADEYGDFKSQVYENIETLYTMRVAPEVDQYESGYSFVGQLLNLARERIGSVQQVEDFLLKYTDDDLEEDAESLLTRVTAAGEAFCGSNCVDKTARFATKLVKRMTRKEGCLAIEDFCGTCADRAAKKVNEMPCCLEEAIEFVKEEATRLIGKYDLETKYDDVRAYFEETLDDEGMAEIDAVIAKAKAEFECVSTVYDGKSLQCA